LDPVGVGVIRPGPARHRGGVDVDDNANGIIDVDAELGATGSDDVCQVEPRADVSGTDDSPVLTLQHGAFVPASADELQQHSVQWRAVVRGRTSGDPWSFLVALPEAPRR
jgi:hypothetical protein